MSLIFLWKLWLRLNFLTKDVANDYIAEMSTVNNPVGDNILIEGDKIKIAPQDETGLGVFAFLAARFD